MAEPPVSAPASRGTMNALRRAARHPLLARVVLRPRVRATIARVLALRFLSAAFATTTPLAFVGAELLGQARGPRPRTHTLRGSGRPVVVTHGRDLEAFYELFHRGEYQAPDELAPLLSRERVSTVLDVGANVGMFSIWAATQWPQARIVAFEPDPTNVATMRHGLAVSGVSVDLIDAAAGITHGTVTFVGELGGGSHIAAVGERGISVPMVDLFDYLAEADFLKLDIEGGEWPILADPRLAESGPLVIAMEYHRVGAPFLPALDAARAALESAGFTTGHARPNEWGHGILWAWN
ncbi:MAG: FkbM family methyltransferase [Tetrasphaera sp.]|nr:FkbM family methyltransferase [Tetrasphaera sp.]